MPAVGRRAFVFLSRKRTAGCPAFSLGSFFGPAARTLGPKERYLKKASVRPPFAPHFMQENKVFPMQSDLEQLVFFEKKMQQK